MCNCLTSSFFLHLHPLSMSSPAAFVKSMRFLGYEYSCVNVNSMPYSLSCPGNASATCFRVLCKCRMPRGVLRFHELKTEFSARLTGDPFLQMKENKFSGFLTSLGIFFKQIYNNMKHSYTGHITRHQSFFCLISLPRHMTASKSSWHCDNCRRISGSCASISAMSPLRHKVHWKDENQLRPTSWTIWKHEGCS